MNLKGGKKSILDNYGDFGSQAFIFRVLFALFLRKWEVGFAIFGVDECITYQSKKSLGILLILILEMYLGFSFENFWS